MQTAIRKNDQGDRRLGDVAAPGRADRLDGDLLAERRCSASSTFVVRGGPLAGLDHDRADRCADHLRGVLHVRPGLLGDLRHLRRLRGRGLELELVPPSNSMPKLNPRKTSKRCTAAARPRRSNKQPAMADEVEDGLARVQPVKRSALLRTFAGDAAVAPTLAALLGQGRSPAAAAARAARRPARPRSAARLLAG